MNIDPIEIRMLIRIATQRTGRPLHDEDLEQDATLKAMEAFRKQFEVRHPHAFLRKIVCDTVRDHWRRRRQSEDLNTIDEKQLAECPSFEEKLDLQRRVTLLRLGLDRLDAGKRTTLDLFYIEECPVSEVKMELLRARRLLAKIVKGLGERHGSDATAQ
jgi:RNA polymerase sigma factor (sigma-70 family)